MLKTRLTQKEVLHLTQQLRAVLINAKGNLEYATQKATNDSHKDFTYDYKVINDIINSVETADIDSIYKNRKPKGKILIMLSYNEPLIMSIDPIVSALMAGNEVYVRPSNTSSQVFHDIWDPVFKAIPWLSERLSVIKNEHQAVLDLIPSVQAVYFFGSRHVAEKIGVECSKHLIEFWPETEGSDFAVYSDTAPLATKAFADYVYDEAFSHAGQICQRLQGIYVHISKYESLKMMLESAVKNSGSLKFHAPSNQQIKMRERYNQLTASYPTASYIQGKFANTPSLITGIPSHSLVCQDAFFLPTLWLILYDSDESLVKEIARRPLQFGANVWTLDSTLIESIAKRTRLTRITVNTNHIDIRLGEGWGGSQPTSYGGNVLWSHKFTNQYEIIDQ